MASALAIYSHWTDELIRTGTVTLETGSAETDYPVELVFDDDPGHVFRSPDLAVAIQVDFLVATPLALISLVHSTLESTDAVKIEGSDTANWAAPTASVAITPAGWEGSGVTRWPINTWKDLTGSSIFSTGYKSYRICFGITANLAQPLQIGQIRLEPAIRNFELQNGFTETRLRPLIENVTSFNIATMYDRGTTQWGCTFDIIPNDAMRLAFQAQWSDVNGRARPWLFIPDGLVNRCYIVRWASTQEQVQRTWRTLGKISAAVEEVGRGLRPGT